MHREESDELVACALCGATIAPASDRGYSFGENAVLCFQCAERRGGRYDSDEDRWTSEPSVGDLVDPHPRER